MGDEGVGWHIIDRLAADPRLSADTELLWCGTDLLACAAQIEGRTRITLLDALLDPSRAGSVLVFADGSGLRGVEDRQGHVHHLSLVQAIHLLRIVTPSVKMARLSLIAICIDSACMQPELSPSLAGKMSQILERVLQELAEG
jgi:hydrogenase maturation protease